jgi:hypothetical protein
VSFEFSIRTSLNACPQVLPAQFASRSYQELFEFLLIEKHMIPIGLYRRALSDQSQARMHTLEQKPPNREARRVRHWFSDSSSANIFPEQDDQNTEQDGLLDESHQEVPYTSINPSPWTRLRSTDEVFVLCTEETEELAPSHSQDDTAAQSALINAAQEHDMNLPPSSMKLALLREMSSDGKRCALC